MDITYKNTEEKVEEEGKEEQELTKKDIYFLLINYTRPRRHC